MKNLLVLALAFTLSTSIFAADNTAPPAAIPQTDMATKASVDKLLDVMNAQSLINSAYSAMDNMFKNMFTQMGVGEKDKAIEQKYSQKMWAIIKQDMNWSKMKGPMEDLYAKNFTEKEVLAMTKFYSSPEGQSMLKKMPAVMQGSMSMAQNLMKDTMPKIQELGKQMQDEIRANQQPKK